MLDTLEKGFARGPLQRLLAKVLPVTNQLHAFCVTSFPDVASQISSEMPRASMEILLFQMKEPADILRELRLNYPAETMKYEVPVDPAPSRSTISSELRDSILKIVEHVAWPLEAVSDAYYLSAPPQARYAFDGDRRAGLVPRMLLSLATGLRQSDGVHPILRFVLHLMKISTGQTYAVDLLEWFDAASAQLGFEVSGQQALRREIDNADLRAERKLHLAVCIEKSVAAPNRYFVRAYRVLVWAHKESWSDGDAEPLRGDTDRLYDLSELRGRLSELVLQLGEDIRRAKNQLTIEIFAPLELLGCDADRWAPDPDPDFGAVPFGVEYEVVVRSWERAYRCRGGPIVARWEAKWQQVHEALAGVAWACAWKDAAAGITPKLLLPAGPACVALSFVPPLDTVGHCAPVLRDLIAAGTPIAVWPRRSAPNDDRLPTWIHQLIAESPPPTWPKVVKDYRAEAYCQHDETHPGHHLTVLRDDPNKLLPDARAEARLVSPKKTRNAAS